jgi:hypothetical protein
VVNELGDISALPREDKLSGSVVDPDDGFPEGSHFVDTVGNSVVKVGLRAEWSSQGSGGIVVREDTSGAANVLCVPAIELLQAAERADEAACAFNVCGARNATSGAETDKGGVDTTEPGVEQVWFDKGLAVVDVPLIASASVRSGTRREGKVKDARASKRTEGSGTIHSASTHYLVRKGLVVVRHIKEYPYI